MSAAKAATCPRGEDVAAYEGLRAGVVARSASGGHYGLALLLREGIAAWIAHGRSCAAAPAVDPVLRTAAPVLSDALHADVVRLLATMALAGPGRPRGSA